MADTVALERIIAIYNSFFTTSTSPDNNPIIPDDNVNIGDIPTEANKPTSRAQALLPAKSNGKIHRDAMKEAYDEIYKNTPSKVNPLTKSKTGEYNEQTGYCARYVYNLALRYTKALRNQSLIDGYDFKPSGNARTANFGNSIVALGYTPQNVGTNVDRSTIIDIINSYNKIYSYGDIFVYYANDSAGESDLSAYNYGHAQIYTGTINLESPPGTNKKRSVWNGQQYQDKLFYSFGNWSSSVKDNYGVNFVYKNRNHNKWTIWLYRSPSS